MRKIIIPIVAACLLVMIIAPATQAKGGSRKWRASYNSALSLHQAAVPKVYKPGTKLRVSYGSKSITVKAVAGGCTCFDLSDEGFRALAGSTSAGVITVKVVVKSN